MDNRQYWSDYDGEEEEEEEEEEEGSLLQHEICACEIKLRALKDNLKTEGLNKETKKRLEIEFALMRKRVEELKLALALCNLTI